MDLARHGHWVRLVAWRFAQAWLCVLRADVFKCWPSQLFANTAARQGTARYGTGADRTMKLAKIRQADGQHGVALVEEDRLRPLAASAEFPALTQILEAADPAAVVQLLASAEAPSITLADAALLPPIDDQEV
mgnify:CR=1 FL=1